MVNQAQYRHLPVGTGGSCSLSFLYAIAVGVYLGGMVGRLQPLLIHANEANALLNRLITSQTPL